MPSENTSSEESICTFPRGMVAGKTRPVFDEAAVGARRKVLVVGSAPLFGSAVEGLLGAQCGKQVEVASVRTVEAAIDTVKQFRPDVIVVCLGRDDLRDDSAWQRFRLMEAYPTRIVRCTLEHNHLTIYDTTRIADATAEDLLSVVCDMADTGAANNKGGEG